MLLVTTASSTMTYDQPVSEIKGIKLSSLPSNGTNVVIGADTCFDLKLKINILDVDTCDPALVTILTQSVYARYKICVLPPKLFLPY